MTPVLQPQLEKVTLEQYEMLPEEKRFEVFDGVIYDMASPSQVHQALSMQLSTLINTYILRKKSDVYKRQIGRIIGLLFVFFHT